MNCQGLAIAVDSAVSLGGGGRSYPSAEKLFPLANGAPVAIAIFGSAQFIGIPWKVVIETFIAEMGSQRFATLREYQAAFLAFCASAHPLFNAELESADFGQTVSAYWRHYLQPIFLDHGEDTRNWDQDAWEAVREWLARDPEFWPAELMPGFDADFARELLEEFSPEVDRLQQHWFDGQIPPDDVWQGMLGTIERIVTRDVIGSNLASGIVFLGYGEDEYFPSFSQVSIGTRLRGRLRWQQADQSSIAVNGRTGSVQVFAQPDMVDAFILGIPRRMREPLRERIEEAAQSVLQQAQVPQDVLAQIDVSAEAEAATSAFFGMLHAEFRAPMMAAVAALPTRELAGLSRTLVSLAAFRSQLAADETGSVGGEIKVAVLTKHGGLQLVS